MIEKETIDDLKSRVIAKLTTVYDPEIPVNIYDLGLIYDIEIPADRRVVVTMTLTSPNCPMVDELIKEIQEKVESIEGIEACNINVVFDPPWDVSRLSEEAKLELGML